RPLPNAQCTKNYSLRQSAALNLNIGPVAGDGMLFELKEPSTGQMAHYAYVGAGIGAGLPFDKITKIKKIIDASKGLRTLKSILSGAVTVPGPPNPFSLTTTCTTTVYDFTGFAGFYSASLALGTPYSRNAFGFGGLRGFLQFRVLIDPFTTANSIGLP